VVRAPVLLPVAVAAGALLLGLAAPGLDLLVAALRELGALLEAPAGPEPRVPRRRLAVDEAEGGVVRGREPDGVLEPREVEDGVASGGERPLARRVAVQSAMRPSLSEREKGAKGTDAEPPPKEDGAAAASGGPHPSGL